VRQVEIPLLDGATGNCSAGGDCEDDISDKLERYTVSWEVNWDVVMR